MLIPLLEQARITPILCDIGASDQPPASWMPIAARAHYLGFDADARDLHTPVSTTFARVTIVNKAVSAIEEDTVTFFLTRSPHCSSTLQPENERLAAYSYAALFDVESQVTVPAITLNRVLSELGLNTIDALKIDSQGTDLRLFFSLDAPIRDRVLALDVEPGLIDAYQGEDLFAPTHQALREAGFWLYDVDVKRVTRVPASGLPGFEAPDEHSALVRIHAQSPGWVEARYLRRPETLAPDDQRGSTLLFVFAMMVAQLGFAHEVLTHHRTYHAGDPNLVLMQAMLDQAVQTAITRSKRIEQMKAIGRPLVRFARSVRQRIGL